MTGISMNRLLKTNNIWVWKCPHCDIHIDSRIELLFIVMVDEHLESHFIETTQNGHTMPNTDQ